MDELPYKLKEELQIFIHQRMYQDVTFFNCRDDTFLAWISAVLKTIVFEENQFLYKEG